MKLVIALLLLASCLESHPANTESLANSDCYKCHSAAAGGKPDYENTTMASRADPAVPDHIANASVYTTRCGDCHVTTTWFSHPEKLFPITQAAHASVPCDSCHLNSADNTGDAHGANTQCVSCHPATEIVAGQTLVDDHLKHPDNIFPQNHHHTGNWQCLDCHTSLNQTFDGYQNPPAGFTGQNFCLSCHPTGGSTNTTTAKCVIGGCHQDAHHRTDTAPQCLQCHPGGRGGG